MYLHSWEERNGDLNIFFLVQLADNASVQSDLRAEFAAHAYDVNGYLGKRDTLLHYCLLESLRLQPVPAFTLPDKPPRERIVAGYRIPKDVSKSPHSRHPEDGERAWGRG